MGNFHANIAFSKHSCILGKDTFMVSKLHPHAKTKAKKKGNMDIITHGSPVFTMQGQNKICKPIFPETCKGKLRYKGKKALG